MDTVKLEVLKEVQQKSPTAQAFFEYAGRRERNVRSGVSRISAIRAQMAKEGFHPIPRDLVTMFKELEQAGIGELKAGAFKWYIPIRQIAGRVPPKPKQLKARNPLAYPQITTRVEKKLSMCLGNGKDVEIRFTDKLTKLDCKFVCSRLLLECAL